MGGLTCLKQGPGATLHWLQMADSNGQNMAAAFTMGEGMVTSYRWTDFRLPGKLAEGHAPNLLSDKPSGGYALIWRLEQSLAVAWGKRVEGQTLNRGRWSRHWWIREYTESKRRDILSGLVIHAGWSVRRNIWTDNIKDGLLYFAVAF